MAVFKDDDDTYGVYLKSKDDNRIPFTKISGYTQNYGGNKPTREEAEMDMDAIAKSVHRGAWTEFELGARSVY